MSVSSISSTGPSAAELAEMRKQMFNKTDTNSDGSVSKSELTTAIEDAPKPPGATAAQGPDVDEMFSNMDADGDSQISESEMNTAMTKMESERPAGGPPPPDGATGRVLNAKA